MVEIPLTHINHLTASGFCAALEVEVDFWDGDSGGGALEDFAGDILAVCTDGGFLELSVSVVSLAGPPSMSLAAAFS
eukprot:7072294-Ditylum_brightwellii.AAC.1